MKYLNRGHFLAAAVAGHCLIVTLCVAQSNLAGISGVVTDASGGTIPEAAVAATNTQTGVVTNAKTNTSGYYNLENLAIGAYSVVIEHFGFRKYIRESITLTTGQQLGLDVQLQVGETGQAVTVSAEAPLTETRTSDVGQLVESKSIEGLPLGNRRTLNVVQLAALRCSSVIRSTPRRT